MAFYLYFPRTKTLLIHAWKNNDARSAYIISETIPSGHTDQGEATLDSKPLHLSKCHTCWRCTNKHGFCVSTLTANQGRLNGRTFVTHIVSHSCSRSLKWFRNSQDFWNVHIQVHTWPSFLKCSYLNVVTFRLLLLM